MAWLLALPLLCFSALIAAVGAEAQAPILAPPQEPEPEPLRKSPQQQQQQREPIREQRPEDLEPAPFGASLFEGGITSLRDDGLNPDYRIVPGDKVAVNAWGAYQVNDVFIVDTQGNIFLPEIGPIALYGVRNADLSKRVEQAIGRVYRRNVEVYTNLLNASPVAVYVTGRVARPGRYAGLPSDSPIFFLHQAGGIDPLTGSYREISILRRGEPLIDFDLYDFLVQGRLPDLMLQDGDTILVGRRGPTVEVHGDVARPTLIELKDDEQSGEALLNVAKISARSTDITLRGVREGRGFVDTLSVDELRRRELRDGDILSFREEQHAEFILVHLEGEVPGTRSFSVRKGARLIDFLNHVPVDPEIANTGGVHLKRPRVKEQQKQSLEQSLERLERSTMLALSSSTGESQIRVREAELMRTFIDSARKIEPEGRVVVRDAGSLLNILLEEGDVIVVPPRTNVVQVTGEVQVPSALMYSPGVTAREMISRAGGFTRRAATNGVLVVRPSAEIVVGNLDVAVYPGDEILVMPKVDRKIFQNAMDISQVLYHIAVAASVVLRIR